VRNVYPLTPRELEVIKVLSEEGTNSKVAERLGISSYTVRTHLGKINAKLGTHSAIEAYAYVVREGWLK
jgi:DNA-binding CsgD family transcriptional regulator